MASGSLIQPRWDGSTPDWQFFTIAVAMTSIAGFFVIVRIGTRLYTVRSLAWEDYFIVVAMVFGVYATVFDCLSVKAGLGIHNALLTKEQLQRINKWYYFVQAPYKFGIGFTKLSILTLYYRVFANNTFRKVLIGMIVYVSLYTVATGIATIFQCVPIARAWNKDLHGFCVQPTAQWYSFAAFNILAEVIMFFLPMPMIKRLQLPRQQKIGLFAIFALGLFVIVCSVMRLIVIGLYSKPQDTNYTWSDGNHWTTVELNTGIICACLPVLKAPLASLLRRLGITSMVSSYPNRSYGLSTFARDKSSNNHQISSSRQKVTISGDASSEEHIVGKTDWAGMHSGDNGITKTTTVGITYDNFFDSDKA